jgi:hypothetical protein
MSSGKGSVKDGKGRRWRDVGGDGEGRGRKSGELGGDIEMKYE